MELTEFVLNQQVYAQQNVDTGRKQVQHQSDVKNEFSGWTLRNVRSEGAIHVAAKTNLNENLQCFFFWTVSGWCQRSWSQWSKCQKHCSAHTRTDNTGTFGKMMRNAFNRVYFFLFTIILPSKWNCPKSVQPNGQHHYNGECFAKEWCRLHPKAHVLLDHIFAI